METNPNPKQLPGIFQQLLLIPAFANRMYHFPRADINLSINTSRITTKYTVICIIWTYPVKFINGLYLFFPENYKLLYQPAKEKQDTFCQQFCRVHREIKTCVNIPRTRLFIINRKPAKAKVISTFISYSYLSPYTERSFCIISASNALNPVCVSDTFTPLTSRKIILVILFPNLDFSGISAPTVRTPSTNAFLCAPANSSSFIISSGKCCPSQSIMPISPLSPDSFL